MHTGLLLTLLLSVLISASATDLHRKKRQIVELVDLSDGELCLEAGQCRSGCCRWSDKDLWSRCSPLSVEGNICQKNDGLWDIYDDCPCELGLDCNRSSCKDTNN